MREFIHRAWSDIQYRKNLELYLTLTAIIVIFIGEVLGIQSTPVMFNVILGVLGILIYSLIDERHFQEKQEKKLDDLRASSSDSTFFREWDSDELVEQLKRSEGISGVYVANYEFLRRNYDILKDLIVRGGTIRLLYIDPTSKAVDAVLEWPEKLQADKESLLARHNLAVQLLKNLAKFSTSDEQIQVKLLNRMPPLVFTILDKKRLNGTVFATINGFQVSHGARPSFKLNQERDKKWFDFFVETFNNLWKSQEATELNIVGK